MKKAEAKKRIEELRKETAYHAKRYYDDDAPEILHIYDGYNRLTSQNLEKVKECESDAHTSGCRHKRHRYRE